MDYYDPVAAEGNLYIRSRGYFGFLMGEFQDNVIGGIQSTIIIDYTYCLSADCGGNGVSLYKYRDTIRHKTIRDGLRTPTGKSIYKAQLFRF